jgi:hypothetical protein
VTTVKLEATSLTETAADPPAAGQFRIVDANTLVLRVPALTSPGRHALHVRPVVASPIVELWVVVP